MDGASDRAFELTRQFKARCSGVPGTLQRSRIIIGSWRLLIVNTTVLSAINEQINSEFEASYRYLAMAGFCERQKFMGAAKWLRLQSEEERQHGLKLFDFV